MEKQTLCTVWVTFMSKLQQGEVTTLPSNALFSHPRKTQGKVIERGQSCSSLVMSWPIKCAALFCSADSSNGSILDFAHIHGAHFACSLQTTASVN